MDKSPSFSHFHYSPEPETIISRNRSLAHLDDHAGHVLPEKVPAVAVPLGDEAELGDDEVDVHLGGHVHQAAPQAVLREDQEDVLQDGAHVLRA